VPKQRFRSVTVAAPLIAAGAAAFLPAVPAWSEPVKLTASDAMADDRLGVSIDLDGDTLIAGAFRDDDLGGSAGAAYIFRRGPSGWEEEAKLLPSDGVSGDWIGWSVTISGDTAAVGTHNADKVYIFTRSGASWAETAILQAADTEEGDLFGFDLDLEGERLLIGALGHEINGVRTGAAYIFEGAGASWTEVDKLAPLDGIQNGNFGGLLSLDGDTALISAVEDNDLGGSSGSAYIFALTSGGWEEQQKLLAPDGAVFDRFGWSLGLSGDFAVICSRKDAGSADDSGSAYFFERVAGMWTFLEQLSPADEAVGDYFGSEAVLVGNTAVITSQYATEAGNDAGAAYVFTRGSAGWEETGKLLPPASTGMYRFGDHVAMSGEVIAVAASWDTDEAGVYQGSVFVFEPAAVCPGDLNGDTVVDGADLGQLLGAWGGGPGPADLNGDGAVDGADLGLLLGAWGACE
jgi:hypothetical protein